MYHLKLNFLFIYIFMLFKMESFPSKYLFIFMWVWFFQSVGQRLIMECVNSEINLLKRDTTMNVYSRAGVEVLAYRPELTSLWFSFLSFFFSCESVGKGCFYMALILWLLKHNCPAWRMIHEKVRGKTSFGQLARHRLLVSIVNIWLLIVWKHCFRHWVPKGFCKKKCIFIFLTKNNFPK